MRKSGRCATGPLPCRASGKATATVASVATVKTALRKPAKGHNAIGNRAPLPRRSATVTTFLMEDVGVDVQARTFKDDDSATDSATESTLQRADGKPRVVLTPKLATRLLADLLDAYRNPACHGVEDARAIVSRLWGFTGGAEMTRCIEAQANASYVCGSRQPPLPRSTTFSA